VVAATIGEGAYIAEWVEYHLERGGVDGIYAIDNDPQGTPELQALQPKYGDRLVIARDAEKFVSHLSHPRVLHRHFARMKQAGRWIISLDSDEFAVPRDGDRAVIDPPRLRKILEGYAQAGHPAVGFPTLNYAEADPNLFAQTGRLLASSTRRAPLHELHAETLQVYRSYKCAFHSNDYLGMVNPHTPLMLGGAPPTMHLERDLWLHHYFFRDPAFGQKKTRTATPSQHPHRRRTRGESA